MEAPLNQSLAGGAAPLVSPRAVNYGVSFAVGSILLAVLALHSPRLVAPMMFTDDFIYVEESWDWATTRQNLWKPFNEHCMPLGRLSNWALVRLAGRPTRLPLAMEAQNLLAILTLTSLVYLFVRRELGHPFYGLVAMMLFGVSTVYAEAVSWFSCSFGVLAVATLLLALLAAQRWRQTGRWPFLALSALWSALAPAWSAGGILAGPCCCLYVLLSATQPGPRGAGEDKPSWIKASTRHLATAAIPVLGSALFLAVSLPVTASYIMHLKHYDGRTAVQAFGPLVGLEYTWRSLVDNLILGVIGLYGVMLPLGLVGLGLVVISVAAAWWWRLAPQRRLLFLGLALILVSYWLTYSARSGWPYDQIHFWTRYHVMPQLGLTLFVCGGLPRWQGRWNLDPAGWLSRRQLIVLAVLLAVLFAINFPRGLALTLAYDRDETALLQHIEAVDARCRQYHIDADTAHRALGKLPLTPWGLEDDDGWRLLRGSDTPQPISVEEARRLLNP